MLKCPAYFSFTNAVVTSVSSRGKEHEISLLDYFVGLQVMKIVYSGPHNHCIGAKMLQYPRSEYWLQLCPALPLVYTPDSIKGKIGIPKYQCTRCFGRGYSLRCFSWLRYSAVFIRARVCSQRNAVERGRGCGCITLGAVQEKMAGRDQASQLFYPHHLEFVKTQWINCICWKCDSCLRLDFRLGSCKWLSCLSCFMFYSIL